MIAASRGVAINVIYFLMCGNDDDDEHEGDFTHSLLINC